MQTPALLPPAEAEREYSPSSCIGGDWAPYVQAYLERSAQARAAASALGGRWQRLPAGSAALPFWELCLPPPAATPAPVLAFIHGGYWQALGVAHSLFAAQACVARGVAFAALEYTLAPAATLPAIVGQACAAVATLRREAAALGLDATRLTLAGHSAGAHLAAMAALQQASRPAALLLVSGVYWLAPLVATSINQPLGLTEDMARQLSPGLAPLAGLPPARLVWGEVETAAFKQQSLAFAAALRAAGTAARAEEIPARNHFDVVLSLATLAELSSH